MDFGATERPRAPFRLGEWIVRPDVCRIEGPSEQRRLRPMLLDLLVLLAERPGEVVSKDRIFDQLRNNRFVSESTLTRDVAELRRALGDDARHPCYIETIPKRGYRLVADVEAGSFAEPIVAVLPFDSLKAHSEEEYFADGITDAVITELGRIGDLRVVSRQSVLRFKGSTMSLRDIARELGVDALIEGTAILQGKHFRITAQLIQVEPEQHLWAERYEGTTSDLVATERRIALAVAESIRGALAPDERARLESTKDSHPEAHLEYLKARHHWGKWTQPALQTALLHARRAIDLDPTYAPAHEMLARSFAILGYWGYMPGREAYPLAKSSAEHAIDLDESLGDAHAALGLVRWLNDWDIESCASESKFAVALSPSSEFARLIRALFLVTMRGDRQGALDEASAALTLDPLSFFSNFGTTWIYIFTRDYEQAAHQAAATIEMYPEALHAHFAMGHVKLGQERYSEAVSAFETALHLEREITLLGSLGHAYAKTGRVSEARALLTEIAERAASEEVSLTVPAMVHIGLGEHERALALLEKAYRARDGRLFGIATIPTFLSLHNDSGYRNLISRLGLPPLAAEKSSAPDGGQS